MRRILVIEDTEVVRRSVVLMLADAGYEVGEAGDGAAGLQLWREQGADLVVTDLRMPGMNGVEVILQLRAYAPTLPVIAMSGGERSRDLDVLGAVKLLGAVPLLSKPFSGEDLLAAVAAALRSGNAEERRSEGA
jgi:CheY-like chemotaxis protein